MTQQPVRVDTCTSRQRDTKTNRQQRHLLLAKELLERFSLFDIFVGAQFPFLRVLESLPLLIPDGRIGPERHRAEAAVENFGGRRLTGTAGMLHRCIVKHVTETQPFRMQRKVVVPVRPPFRACGKVRGELVHCTVCACFSIRVSLLVSS